jgi:hypothetical protein
MKRSAPVALLLFSLGVACQGIAVEEPITGGPEGGSDASGLGDASAMAEGSGSGDALGSDDASSDAGAVGVAPADAGPADAGAQDSGEAPSGIGVTMNDVSVLFPLPSTQADIENLLAPSATGIQGVLLPSALYVLVGPIAGGTDDPFPDANEPHETFAAYDALRVVAMRIDPCFASLAPDPSGAGCAAQMRLVFQELTWITLEGDAGPAAWAFDSALHASYALSRDQFLTLSRALVALRAANQDGDVLGPLAPHPIMAREGLSGAMSQGVEKLILQYAGADNLVRVAVMNLNAPAFASFGVWGFGVFDVGGAPSTATPRAIPTLVDPSDGGSVYTQGVAGAGSSEANPSPVTTSADNFFPLYLPGEADASFDPPALLDALVRVENPSDNSPETIDCVSCHLATPAEMGIGIPKYGFYDTASPMAFQPDGTNVTRADMAATYNPLGAFGLNVHAFSYRETSPNISQRVVNETAAVVEYVNGLSP